MSPWRAGEGRLLVSTPRSFAQNDALRANHHSGGIYVLRTIIAGIIIITTSFLAFKFGRAREIDILDPKMTFSSIGGQIRNPHVW
jgi:hypothetical protein